MIEAPGYIKLVNAKFGLIFRNMIINYEVPDDYKAFKTCLPMEILFVHFP